MSDLRAKFLNYFDRKGHHVTASTTLIPEGDPTLLFTAAGMVPFKPYFLGTKKGLDRASSCQKCFRTSDIDRVGTTIRHLTFFEMLGNFSFGDYFKESAIELAWEFLTKTIGLDPKRLYPTVFREDDEAETLWKKVALNPVTRLGESDNFWAMGETGPCGPCSEIYYDLGPEMGTGPENVVGGDGDRYTEIWNLVFMQFDRDADGKLHPLPKKNIDTGMGLERLAMIVEGKRDLFHSSLFMPIREAAAEHLSCPSAVSKGTGNLSKADQELAYRIISDHIRASVMLIAEGIIPSNVERGYVLRRLIRRASRYGRLLGAKEPFLHLLIPAAIGIYEGQYPELASAMIQTDNTLRAEEERFLETLENGERALRDLLTSEPKEIPGEAAFKLYDTFGFPLELTKEICGQKGIRIDEAGFAKAQEAAVETARAAWKGSGEGTRSHYDALLQENPGMLRRLEFVGYRKTDSETRIAAVIKIHKTGEGLEYVQGENVKLEPGDDGEVVLLRTPFYGESGGQVGDTGLLVDDVNPGRKIAEVLDTQKPVPGLYVHRVRALKTVEKNRPVRALVDVAKRTTIAYHHTATHLLNEALRRVLGQSIRQAGSYVAADRLRFDFTHPKPMSKEEIAKVETIVKDAIDKDYSVDPKELPISEVPKLKAVTLLGEDYGETPRFLLINEEGWKEPLKRFSLELCGGTHVHRTGEIQNFRIVKESSVAAGIRRIEAVAGPAFEELKRREEASIRQALRDSIKNFIKITSKIQSVTGKPYRDVLAGLPDPDSDPPSEISKILPDLRDLEKKLRSQLEHLKREKVVKQAVLGQVVIEEEGLKLAVQKFDQIEPQTLRTLTDRYKRELGTGVVFLGSADNKRLSFVVGVTQDLVGKGVDANRIAKAVAQLQGGRAGGRKDFAQGGGPDHDWDELVSQVRQNLRA